jgi:hypothetical protein
MTVAPVARWAGPVRISPTSPAALVLAGSGAAWAVLVVTAIAGVRAGPSAVTGHVHDGGGTTVQPWDAAWAGTWLLMVAAMMWPLAVPTLSLVARAAFREWRTGLVMTCLGTVTVLWLAAGLAVASAAHAFGVPAESPAWQLGWVAVAVLLSRSARRARLLWRCSRLAALAPGGARGLASVSAAGIVEWRRCVLLCGPVMTAMVVGHDPVLMLGASLAVWWEAAHPRAWRDRVPVLLLTAAGAWLLLAETVLRG